VRLGGLFPAGRLDRYVGGLFVASYATAFLLVVGLVIVLNLASNLSFFEPWPDGRTASTLDIVRYYVLSIPFLFLEVAPYVTVIAGMFTVSRLTRHNETIATMAAGISTQRMLAPVFLGGALAGLGMFALREVATRTIGPQREALLDVLENQRTERVEKKVWLRDRLGNVIRLGEYRPARREFVDLQATLRRGKTIELVRAERGRWARSPGGPTWLLEGGVVESGGEGALERPILVLEGLSFTPEDVRTALKARDGVLQLSFAEVEDLLRRDPSSAEYQTLLQYLLTFPLANLVLLLVALPFMVGQERGKHVEGLVAGFLLCVFYFAVDFVCRALGMEGDLAPLISSWLPVLLFGSLGAVLFGAMRS
jgi:lipopolysaccharide export system permease protein